MPLPAHPYSGWEYSLRQYAGFFLVVLTGAILVLCYDKGYVPNGYLMIGCLILSLIALALHETRPFKRWENITAEVEEMRREKEADELRRKQD